MTINNDINIQESIEVILQFDKTPPPSYNHINI